MRGRRRPLPGNQGGLDDRHGPLVSSPQSLNSMRRAPRLWIG